MVGGDNDEQLISSQRFDGEAAHWWRGHQNGDVQDPFQEMLYGLSRIVRRHTQLDARILNFEFLENARQQLITAIAGGTNSQAPAARILELEEGLTGITQFPQHRRRILQQDLPSLRQD